jgi:hypothetical protein
MPERWMVAHGSVEKGSRLASGKDNVDDDKSFFRRLEPTDDLAICPAFI